MKNFIGLGMVLGVLALGCVPVFAYDVPGVTRPINPSLYYAPSPVVSVADSTNTPFTMKDLASNGYQVNDASRSSQTVIANIKSATEMVNQ